VTVSNTAAAYLRFSEVEARGVSPRYERLSAAIGADGALIALIDELPRAKRQPNLVLGAARFLGAPIDDDEEFLAWLRAHWPSVREVALARMTQTNEAGRDALLLPVLTGIPGPLALIEVGASAGLCLYPDRYSYRYGTRRLDPEDGPSEVLIDCRLRGAAPLPDELPRVVHRAGVDLNPLDPADEDAVAWLEALIWPEQDDRRRRLRAAARIAARDPARIVAGDLNDHIASLVADCPDDATIVVFHTAVLAYVDEPARLRFADTVRSLDCVWISNEAPGVFPEIADRIPPHVEIPRGAFLLAVDGTPRALTGGHGQWLQWLD
jgi:hypothetical protein